MKTNHPLKRAFWVPFIIVSLMWLVKGLEWLIGLEFTHWGIFPRSIAGLRGILFGPLIHGNIEHLAANSVPFIVLGGGIWYFYRPVAKKLLLWSWLMTGLWTWAGARPAFHIGASGLIYAFASFLFFSGLVRRNIRLAAISLIVVFLYGSMIWGVLPLIPEHSWEGHLSGAIAGLILAIYYRRHGASDTLRKSLPEDLSDDELALYGEEEFQYFYDEKEEAN